MFQGESDTIPGKREHYTCALTHQIAAWRRRWHQGTGRQTDPTFPVGVVQVSTQHRTGQYTEPYIQGTGRQTDLAFPWASCRLVHRTLHTGQGAPDRGRGYTAY